jgi:hypothetical protein
LPAQPKPEKNKPVRPKANHSVYRGMTLMVVRCESCGAVMTEQRRVGGKLWMYCPNDPALPVRPDLLRP